MLTLLVAAQVVGFGILVWRLLPGRRRRPPVPPGVSNAPPRQISIIVATLNEARRIGPCIEGLIAQGDIVSEILFVDSGSTDGTPDIILAAACRDARIRLLRDDPLPSGWVGKVWALQHGLAHATSEWVLGIDADTTPQQGMAAGAVAAAVANRYDAVSFSPRFRIATRAERWLQPALLVTLVYRFGAVGAEPQGDRVMANGQCFLARRSTLVNAGGYSSARASFSDDVTLARHLVRQGLRVGFLDGSRLYDVRSYTSAGEAWREWGRSLDLKDSTSVMRQTLDVVFLLVVQGTPLPALLLAWYLWPSANAALLLMSSAALVVVRVLLQFALAGSYAERGVTFWLSPLADPLAAFRIFLSTIRRPTQWRGREYGTVPPAPAS